MQVNIQNAYFKNTKIVNQIGYSDITVSQTQIPHQENMKSPTKPLFQPPPFTLPTSNTAIIRGPRKNTIEQAPPPASSPVHGLSPEHNLTNGDKEDELDDLDGSSLPLKFSPSTLKKR